MKSRRSPLRQGSPLRERGSHIRNLPVSPQPFPSSHPSLWPTQSRPPHLLGQFLRQHPRPTAAKLVFPKLLTERDRPLLKTPQQLPAASRMKSRRLCCGTGDLRGLAPDPPPDCPEPPEGPGEPCSCPASMPWVPLARKAGPPFRFLLCFFC